VGLKIAGVLSGYLAMSILATWIAADRTRRGRPSFYDFDSAMFHFGPIGPFFYLIKTRGWSGVKLCLLMTGLYCISTAGAAGIAYLVWQLFRS
jgi:hypothetical protein